MLNNLSNIFNLKKGRKFKTTAENKDVLLLGTKDSKYGGEYKPTAILFEDLVAQLESLTNTWDMPATAFVATDGDDNTAIVGNGNKPFSTLTAAANSGAQVVYVLPGTYSTTHALVSGVTYYCAPGVIFNSGTLTALNLSLVDTKWLGHARFEGTFDINLRPQVATRFVFQAETVRVTGAGELFFTATDLSDVYFDLGVLEALPGNTTAPNFSFRGNITGVINIKKVVGYYKPFNLRDIRSNLIVNIDELIVLDGGFAGNASGFKSCLSIESIPNAGTQIEIVINVKRAISLVDASLTNAVIDATVIGENVRVIVNAEYVDANLNPVIRSQSNNANASIVVNVGYGKTKNRAIYSIGSSPLLVKSSTFEQAVQSLVRSSTLFLSEVSFYNIDVINTLYADNATGIVYMNNVSSEGDPATFIFDGVAGSSYGFNNVISTQGVGVTPTNLYAAPGLITDTNFKVPKF
jgi:hypothetical protein